MDNHDAKYQEIIIYFFSTLSNQDKINKILECINIVGINPKSLSVISKAPKSDTKGLIYKHIAEDFKKIIKQDKSKVDDYAIETIMPFIYSTQDIEFIDLLADSIEKMAITNNFFFTISNLILELADACQNKQDKFTEDSLLIHRLFEIPRISLSANISPIREKIMQFCIDNQSFVLLNIFLEHSIDLQENVDILYEKVLESLSYECLNWMSAKRYHPNKNLIFNIKTVDYVFFNNNTVWTKHTNIGNHHSDVKNFLSYVYSKSSNLLPLSQEDNKDIATSFVNNLGSLIYICNLEDQSSLNFIDVLSFHLSQSFSPQKDILLKLFEFLSNIDNQRPHYHDKSLKFYSIVLDLCDKDIAMQLYNDGKILSDGIDCVMLDYLKIKNQLHFELGENKVVSLKHKI